MAAPGHARPPGANKSRPKQNRPPPNDLGVTLRKMLQFEQRRGFDDRTVSGGLDAFLRSASAQAGPRSALFAVVAALPQSGYASLPPAARGAWAQRALALLTPARPQPTTPGPSPAGPRTAAPPTDDPAPPLRRPSGPPRLDDPVAVLGRIRGTTQAKLANIGIETVHDILWHFPSRHVDFSNVKPIAELMVGETATVVGQITKSRVAFIGRRMRSTEATIADDSGHIRCLWFNQPYLAKSLPEGARVGIAGKVGAYRKRPQFDSPEWERLDDSESTHVGRFVPIYPLTQGLPGRTVRKLAREAIDRYLPLLPESLPPAVMHETGYPAEADAIRDLHFPESMGTREVARERLAFQELLAIQLAVVRRKREDRARADAPVIRMAGEFLQDFVQALPFQLTNAQTRAITELRTDLARPEPMARLLQGDVGSGKTVVAAVAMLAAVAQGFQAVLMAPTEILAEQHFQTFGRIFGGGEEGSIFHNYTVAPALGRPVRMALLTGSTPARRKREIVQAIRDGQLDMVVGTHALIEEAVSFEKLGLAVVDEQHRFGVLQRETLRNRREGGGSPHLLVMTATPIPRTLALTIYGDLDVSRLDELPPGRQRPQTRFAGPDDRDDVYARVRSEIRAGHQVFFICPLVEESEAIEAKSAVQEFERLRSAVFPDLADRMRLLHGRMHSGDKESAMADFRERRADILVSTAVIEVGIDIPNATVMVIEGADRFGLSQLHQFRGRVGRDEHASYCFLLTDAGGEPARERLTLMESTADGFELAEADLRMRGPGEYFGTRQSGLPDLRVAKLTDHALLLQARNWAERLLDLDPNLRAPEHQPLARMAGRMSIEGADAVH
ncbi:MAG: ATP-dependent DNA helicase RecG [Chloroflexi bacterium]|nr:MAG: ATP-dependent DNA helicase RecG [Chloroflexota bacterium]